MMQQTVFVLAGGPDIKSALDLLQQTLRNQYADRNLRIQLIFALPEMRPPETGKLQIAGQPAQMQFIVNLVAVLVDDDHAKDEQLKKLQHCIISIHQDISEWIVLLKKTLLAFAMQAGGK
jgi:hypothetical protein